MTLVERMKIATPQTLTSDFKLSVSSSEQRMKTDFCFKSLHLFNTATCTLYDYKNLYSHPTDIH